MIAPRSHRQSPPRQRALRPATVGRSLGVRALVALGCLSTSLALAAPQKKSAANIEADLAFARGLASKWSFVDLAEDVIRDVESGRLEDDQAASLALLRCEIYTVGARNERDPARRNQLFEEALACLDSYISKNPYAANKGDAEEAFVSTSQLFARSLQISGEEAIGEEAAAFTARRIEVLTKGVQRTAELIEALAAIPEADRTEAQTNQRFELMLNRGQMYATISSAQKDDPFFKEQAIKVLEELVFAANDEVKYILRAYAALGDVYAGNNEFEEAAGYYDAVADQVVPIEAERREQLDPPWSKMPQPLKQRRFLFVELSMPGILKSYMGSNEDQKALSRAFFFWNLYRKEGFDLSQFGYDALIQVARVMLASEGYVGGDDSTGDAEWFATEEEMTAKYRQRRLQQTTTQFALKLATQVVNDAPSNAQKSEGTRVLSEIAKRPGVEIALASQYEAAFAKYREKDFVGARKALNELMVRLDGPDASERILYGAKVYNLLGNVLRQEDRMIEAAMAFREGAVNWSDPEFDENNAKSFQFIVARMARAASEDADLRALRDEAETVVTTKGPAAQQGTINFTRGKRAQDAENWAEAIQNYEQVTDNDEDYEIAYVNIGVCLFRNSQVAEALARFDKYLTEVRDDPARKTESPSALARRKGASATAEFYRGYISHLIADQRFKTRNGDTSGYAKVIEAFDGYDERYPEQTNFCAIALKAVVDSYSKLNDTKAAQAKLDVMVERFPDARQSADAAIALFKTYEAKHLAAVDSGAQPADLAVIQRNMAEALAVSNRIAASPDWQNLKSEADLWFGLGEWARAKVVFARIVSRFSEDKARKSNVERFVIPNLAFCMLQLRELNDAKDLLAPMVMTGTPTKASVQYFAMAVTGWLEGGVAGVTQVPGTGGTDEEFKFVTDKLTSIQRSGQNWTTCEWYEDKLAEMYAFYIWGQSSPAKKDSAKNMIEGTQPFLVPANDTTFAVVEHYCTEESETPPELKARLGNGTLRARYQWLWSKTR